jgi:hypothetical protein
LAAERLMVPLSEWPRSEGLVRRLCCPFFGSGFN